MKKLFRVIWIVLRDNRAEVRIPDDAIKALAKVFYENLLAYLETEEGKRDYERLLKEEQAENG